MADTATKEQVLHYLRKVAAHDAANYDGTDHPHCQQCARDEAVVLDVADDLAEHWDQMAAGEYVEKFGE